MKGEDMKRDIEPGSRKILTIPRSAVEPDPTGVLAQQGIPPHTPPPPRVRKLYDTAVELYRERVNPVAVADTISAADFSRVFEGEGRNETGAPLGNIFPRARHLALMALTLGEPLCAEIRHQFETKNLAVGYMLDAVASYCAEKAVAFMEHRQRQRLPDPGTNQRVLLYSPGYCGWHVSAQGALFQRLNPGEIGIRLNKSHLMEPLKSVSGVLAAGESTLHRFENNFPFCGPCKNRTCRERMDTGAVAEQELNH